MKNIFMGKGCIYKFLGIVKDLFFLNLFFIEPIIRNE